MLPKFISCIFLAIVRVRVEWRVSAWARRHYQQIDSHLHCICCTDVLFQCSHSWAGILDGDHRLLLRGHGPLQHDWGHLAYIVLCHRFSVGTTLVFHFVQKFPPFSATGSMSITVLVSSPLSLTATSRTGESAAYATLWVSSSSVKSKGAPYSSPSALLVSTFASAGFGTALRSNVFGFGRNALGNLGIGVKLQQ